MSIVDQPHVAKSIVISMLSPQALTCQSIWRKWDEWKDSQNGMWTLLLYAPGIILEQQKKKSKTKPLANTDAWHLHFSRLLPVCTHSLWSVDGSLFLSGCSMPAFEIVSFLFQASPYFKAFLSSCFFFFLNHYIGIKLCLDSIQSRRSSAVFWIGIIKHK